METKIPYRGYNQNNLALFIAPITSEFRSGPICHTLNENPRLQPVHFLFSRFLFLEQSSMERVGVDLMADGNGVLDPPAKLVLEGGFQGAQGVQFVVMDKDWSPPSVRAIQKRRNTDVSFSLSILQPIPRESKMWVSVSLEEAYEKTLVKEGLCPPQPHKKGLPASERKRQRVDRIVRQITVSEGCKETIRYQIIDGSDKLEKLIFNNLALRLFLSTSETATPECIHLIRTSPFLMYSRRLKPLPCSLLLPSPFPSKPGATLPQPKEKLQRKKAKNFRIVQQIPRCSPRLRTRAVKRAASTQSSFDLPLIPSPNKTASVLFTKSLESYSIPLSSTFSPTRTPLDQEPISPSRELLPSRPLSPLPSSPLSPLSPSPPSAPSSPNAPLPAPPQQQPIAKVLSLPVSLIPQTSKPTLLPSFPPRHEDFHLPESSLSSHQNCAPPPSPDLMIFHKSPSEEDNMDDVFVGDIPPSSPSFFSSFPPLLSPLLSDGEDAIGDDFLFNLECSLVFQ